MNNYDSRLDTHDHIHEVQTRVLDCAKRLIDRALQHDQSKLSDPEKAVFDEFTPKLKSSTYGSEEYKSFLAAMKPALDHHYAANTHHPEHYANGIAGMSLLDILEMLIDAMAGVAVPDCPPPAEAIVRANVPELSILKEAA